MFSAFIWAIAPEVPEKQFYPAVVDPLSFDVNDYKTWNSLRLQNAQLMNLATEIQSTGLGSLREIYLGIIPPLSCAKRLQSDAVVEHVLQKVLAYETSCRWGMAFRAYLQLLDMCEKGCSAYMFVRKAVDATIEFLLQVAADPPAEDKDPLDSGGMDLENIKRTLVHKLKGPALRNVTAELKISYVRQGRIEEYEKLFHNITSDSKGAKRVSENRVLRLRGPDTVGWRPHHLILTQKDKDWEDHQRAKQIASKVNHDIDIAGRSFLHYAVMKNRPILARALLQTANFNLRGRDGRTPLHWAAILGYRNMTNLLLEKRTVKDGKDNAGRTALHLAAWAGHRDIVELLLERNVNKNDVDNAARTALHFASWKGELDVVQLLLERKADKDAVDELGRTALHFTAWAGQQNIVDFLLKKNLEIDASDNAGRTALHLAVWANHRDTVNQLLEKNAKRNRKDKYGWTPLSLAARNGDMDMVQQLLDANVNVEALDHMGMTAWDLASVAGHRKDWDLMMLLETKKIKQHKQEYTVRPDGPPQRSSSQDVENDVVKQPLEMSARVDDLPCAERTVLHSAALAGDQDRVEQLLSEKHNISIDARDQEGRTALHLAAWKGYHGIVELLLENEARKDVKDVENRRPIHLAAWAGYPIVVNLLLLDLKTDKGMPLWIKIKDDERDREIEIREENRLMLNPKDKYGWTPLSIAAGNGRVAVVELLIKFGADLFSNDNSAKTALLLADENVRSLLLRHGALLDAKDTIRPDKPSDRRVPQFDSETLPQDLQYAAESSASLPPPPFPGPNPEFKKGKPVPKVDSLLLKDSGSLRALAEG
jgi:ankyrin repeat protein